MLARGFMCLLYITSCLLGTFQMFWTHFCGLHFWTVNIYYDVAYFKRCTFFIQVKYTYIQTITSHCGPSIADELVTITNQSDCRNLLVCRSLQPSVQTPYTNTSSILLDSNTIWKIYVFQLYVSIPRQILCVDSTESGTQWSFFYNCGCGRHHGAVDCKRVSF